MFDRLITRTRWLVIFQQHLLTTRRTFLLSYSAGLELSVWGHCSSTPESFRARIFPWNTSTVRYSTFTGERELQPFREERGICRQSLWHCDCWLNTFYTSHCQLPDMVWSLQQVWPFTEEEELLAVLFERQLCCLSETLKCLRLWAHWTFTASYFVSGNAYVKTRRYVSIT